MDCREEPKTGCASGQDYVGMPRATILENGLRCAYSSFRRKISHISTGERRSTRRASDRSGVRARNRCVIAVWLESSKDWL